MGTWNYSDPINDTEWLELITGEVMNNDSTDGVEYRSVSEAILVGVVLGCIILMTICGNVLVLVAVYVNAHLRSTTNYFIVNLAIADLLLGVTVLPLSATLESLRFWPFGYTICDLWASADVLWCTASIMTLCVISIDRYIGVTRPLQHSSIITQKRALIIIISVWILSAVISVAPLIGWKETTKHDAEECTVTKHVGYVVFSVSCSFYIPLMIIIVVYARIYREATLHSRFLNTGIKTTKIDEHTGVVLRIHMGRNSAPVIPAAYQSSSSSEHSEGSGRKLSSRMTLAGKVAKFNKEKKAAKTLGIVVGVFIICWFPFFFCLPLDVLCESCTVPEDLFTVIFWLGYCNSLMNPIIYASSSKEFKRAFIRILRCQYKLKPRLFLESSGSYNEMRRFGNTLRRPRYSNSVSHNSANDEMPENNYCLERCDSESPCKSLQVHQHNHRLSRTNLADATIFDNRSSVSSLADDENSDNFSLNYSGSQHKHAVVRLSPQSQIGSFAQDENYINAFRNVKKHSLS